MTSTVHTTTTITTTASTPRFKRRWTGYARLLGALGLLAIAVASGGRDAAIEAQSSCGPAVNPIVCENQKPGDPAGDWDVTGSGDASIQGFATEMSVVPGQVVQFKIRTTANDYTIDIYRLGYYGGSGARRVAAISPSVALPQAQPACLTNATTGLVDCGNWAVSASWTVPADAVSGIYFARLVRTDTGGESHIIFVVRDDTGRSDLLFQTSDATWQAYNSFGGNSLYQGGPGANPGRAYKVSYNRPLVTRGTAPATALFSAEYPMVRWLEANGYNVSYFTSADSDRYASKLLDHKVFLSVGHDEYWSGGQRTNVEAARAAGVHLAFFSGNELFWKTRWEPSIDGSNTAYRTLVSYKETHANQVIDPADPPTWTGTWRDPRFSPPGDGGRPENALTGTFFTVACCQDQFPSIAVSADAARFRFWRNSPIAASGGGSLRPRVSGAAVASGGILGYEWDEDLDNGFRPGGLMQLSSTSASVSQRVEDHGSTFGPGIATHALTLYRHASGALVFGAGTVQWSWGLDNVHDNLPDVTSDYTNLSVQQATVNLLADMDATAGSLQAGLTAAVKSTDLVPPTTTITSPANGSVVASGTPVTISGTAADADGRVVAVEVSTDGGATWKRANGRDNWTFAWTATAPGAVSVKSRASDDSGNLETPGAGITVTVSCPCSIWNRSTAVPAVGDAGDSNAVELGVKFRSDLDGFITGVRFFKSAGNVGTHVGNLWTTAGTLLATATFTAESAVGWQEVSFGSVVPVTAGTVYVASYHTDFGHYSISGSYFASAGVDTPPLHALANTASANGVYKYGASGFPSFTFGATNYWVDVVFNTSVGDSTPPAVTATTPIAGATNVATSTVVRATFNEAVDPATVTTSTFDLRDATNAIVAATVTYDAPSRTATLTPNADLAVGATYTARVRGGTTDPRIKDLAGNPQSADVIWSFSTGAAFACPCTIWPATTVPAVVDSGDGSALELGVKFRAETDGFITALRFYKSAANTGTHVGHLWTSTGTLLATATFSGETASGWQQVSFGSPVPITAETVYVASYHTNTGHYSASNAYFASAGVDAPPLHALATTTSLNGVFLYGPAGFPADSFNATNYWVDVVFDTTVVDTTPATVTSTAPAAGATNVAPSTTVRATFSEPMDAATITTSTFDLRDAANALVAATVTYDAASRTATLTPTSALATGASYTARVHGGAADPRVKDRAGNALADDVVWSFTTGAPVTCPCTIWPPTAVPSVGDAGDANAVELGVKFRADVDGFITGLRFFKSAGNTGTHVGNFWATNGALLASATFTGETSTGWQQVTFTSPVAVSANTVYVASYHTNSGHYSTNSGDFASTGVDAPPLHALAAATSVNGVFLYGATGFPNQSFNATNYWVDVVFNTSVVDTTPPTVTATTPAAGATSVAPATTVRATFSESVDSATVTTATFDLRDGANALVAATVTYDAPSRTATLTPAATLASGGTYTARVHGGAADPRVKDLAGNALAADVAWTFTTGAPVTCPCTIWPPTAVPVVGDAGDANAVELGVKFRADVDGFITGLRYFKSAGNTGTHVGNLWAADGTNLATATFSSETSSGWQQVSFASAIAITANTVYIASYHTNSGHYSISNNYFATTGVDAPPLHALASPTSLNGVFGYGPSAFPSESYNSTNYWVDVVFATSVVDTTPPTVTATTPAAGATNVVPPTTVRATFSEPLDPATVGTSTFDLRDGANALVAATVTYDVPSRTAMLTPGAALVTGVTYTARVHGGVADPRVKDLAGNALAADVAWSFTVGVAVSCPCTIWPPTATPAVNDAGDTNAVELGVKFRADVDGTITGLRFFKSSGNTGTHVGNLWTAIGTLLATATFSGETASGWQQVNFGTAVPVTANTVYVASYHTNSGHYSVSSGYFASAGVDSGPLHALASTTSLNGVFVYGPSGFPNESFNATNYWVDVVFNTSGPSASLPALLGDFAGNLAAPPRSWQAPLGSSARVRPVATGWLTITRAAYAAVDEPTRRVWRIPAVADNRRRPRSDNALGALLENLEPTTGFARDDKSRAPACRTA